MEFKKIKEIAITNPENISKKYKNNYINYLDTANITKNKIDNIVKISIQNAPSRAKRLVKPNDIIYSTVRPNLCHYGIINNNMDDTLVVSTGFTVLRVLEEYNPLYIYVALTRKEITEQLHSIASSAVSAYPSIKPSDIEEVVIPIPDRKIQDKIAMNYFNLITKSDINEQEYILIEKISKLIYSDWFENNIKDDWIDIKLSDICEFNNGFAFKSKDLLKEYKNDSYKVFKQGNIKTGGGIDHYATKSYISIDNLPKNEKYKLKYGDILMCMTDMKDNVVLLGHTAYMDTNDEYYVNQRVGLLRAKSGIPFGYIYLLTNSTSFLNRIRSKANSGVQVNLSKEAIEQIEFKVPSYDKLESFGRIINPLFSKMSILSNENRVLNELINEYVRYEFNKLGSD